MIKNVIYLLKILKNSFFSLLNNKRRSLLTMLGIIIGVSSVIIIVAIGESAQSLILSQVEGMGSNLVIVMPGKSDDGAPPASAMGVSITTLTYKDAMSLNEKHNVPSVDSVTALYNGVGNVNWESHNYDTNLIGSSVNYLKVEGSELEQGRFFTKQEEYSYSKVVILGHAVKNELFGQVDPLGKRVKIKNQFFTVIGYTEERGAVGFQDYDDLVVMPVTVMQKLIAGVNHLGAIKIRVDEDKNVDQAIDNIKKTLRENHGILDSTGEDDDFTVRSSLQAVEMISSITDGLKYFLAIMAGLSLLIGGIGIMNIMLVRVVKRTREIGLRKAVGANNNDIILQFLVESISITMTGGMIGIIVGVIISWLIVVVANVFDYEVVFGVNFFSIIIAVFVSVVIGLVFGIYPAKKASRLEPITALHYE